MPTTKKSPFKNKLRTKRTPPMSAGIGIKKQFGQHFLRNESVIETMINSVELDSTSSIMEIGCGDGVLTRAILKTAMQRLWVFEIDPEWASYVEKTYADPRMTIFCTNILDVDLPARCADFVPWTLLANLPYQITFPILHKLQKNKNLFKEGVIMVQEEVAQKITQTTGRGAGFISLFFQHHFTWQLLTKMSPQDFHPAPKVYSRLLYFKPRADVPEIPEEELFWQFIKACFKSPRRTLRNNLSSHHYAIDQLDVKVLDLRAQQLIFADFLKLWLTLQK